MKLLILDDNKELAEFMAVVSQRRGWTVKTAHDQADFRAQFGLCEPDAILLDLHLGNEDGVAQLRFLSQAGYRGAVAIISGFDKRVLESARQIGESLGLIIAAGLGKPIRTARLNEVLDEIAKKAQAPKPHAPKRQCASDFRPADIAAGLLGEQMRLYLQPIVSSSNGHISHFESLIRWQHPHLGLVSPDDFVGVAERDEAVIDLLTDWVVNTAVGHHHRIAVALSADSVARSGGGGAGIPISVNLSGINLHNLDFPDRMAAIVEKAGLTPHALIFEVTESVAMRDEMRTTDILTRLRLKGFALAIDDFGIGHSSLKALRQIPFSEIKIDKSFVGDMRSSRNALAIVRSVIELGRSLDLDSVAEGVENDDIADLLGELGANKLQGYHFSRPMALDAALTWLANRQREERPAVPESTTTEMSERVHADGGRRRACA
jgi:EAL domain-containing protein (putative c-di-GMP-specific phosphodiesterase class I)/ActR/RegA family two-component response regulator